MNRGWTDFDQQRLEKMWAEGMTSNQIAEATGRTRSAVMGRLNRCGIRRPQRSAEQTKAAFATHLANGHEVIGSAQRLGITKSHAYAQLAAIREDLGWQAR